jgi:hypothetical protein
LGTVAPQPPFVVRVGPNHPFNWRLEDTFEKFLHPDIFLKNRERKKFDFSQKRGNDFL